MKGDVVDKLERVKEVSEPVYTRIIDSVATTYEKGKKASRDEIKSLALDLKKRWKTLGARAQAVRRETARSVNKVAAKAVS